MKLAYLLAKVVQRVRASISRCPARALDGRAAAADAAQSARRNDGAACCDAGTSHGPQTYLDQTALSLQNAAFVAATFAVLQRATFMEVRNAESAVDITRAGGEAGVLSDAVLRRRTQRRHAVPAVCAPGWVDAIAHTACVTGCRWDLGRPDCHGRTALHEAAHAPQLEARAAARIASPTRAGHVLPGGRVRRVCSRR